MAMGRKRKERKKIERKQNPSRTQDESIIFSNKLEQVVKLPSTTTIHGMAWHSRAADLFFDTVVALCWYVL